MSGIKVSEQYIGGNPHIVAEGPSPEEIRQVLQDRLVSGINKKIDMEFARQLVALGWTPPPGHPVLDEKE